ncbi:MAG: hypothetical protein ACR2PZ_25005 [Pseudomonadales bacterium]
MSHLSLLKFVAAAITHVRLAAAHEGTAELIVTVGYDNGGQAEVALDRHASEALLNNCDAQGLEQLIGQSWQQVRDALARSYNRYQ